MTADSHEWSHIQDLLNAAKSPISYGLPPDDTARRRILRERSQVLAREPKPAIDRRDSIEIIEFQLAEERYGIELVRIREVCILKEFTPVPCVPPFVLGVINLRGEIHTIIDLKRLFGLPEAGLTQLNAVLLMDSTEMKVGILADDILGVRRIPLASLSSTLPTLGGLRASSLRGVTSDRLIVLNSEKILSSDAILVHDEVES